MIVAKKQEATATVGIAGDPTIETTPPFPRTVTFNISIRLSTVSPVAESVNRFKQKTLPQPVPHKRGNFIPFGLCAPAAAGTGIRSSACNTCHEDALSSATLREYLHMPFAQQHCGECHAAKNLVAGTKTTSSASTSTVTKKITWLGDSIMTATDHEFLLPGDKVGNKLIVESQALDGSPSRQEIAVPSLSGLPEAADDGQTPAISNLQVLKVERGVFLSATIAWQTDALTDALVRYGTTTDNLTQSSDPTPRLGHEHEVVLYQLQPDQTYHFRAVSRDLFSRGRESKDLTFSTAGPTNETPPESSPPADGTIGITGRFSRLGKDYLLKLTLTHSAAVSVGWSGKALNQVTDAGDGCVNR